MNNSCSVIIEKVILDSLDCLRNTASDEAKQVLRLKFLEGIQFHQRLNSKEQLPQALKEEIENVKIQYLFSNNQPKNKNKKPEQSQGSIAFLKYDLLKNFQDYNHEAFVHQQKIKALNNKNSNQQTTNNYDKKIKLVQNETKFQQRQNPRIENQQPENPYQRIQPQLANLDQIDQNDIRKEVPQAFKTASEINPLKRKPIQAQQEEDTSSKLKQVKKFKPPSKVGSKIIKDQAGQKYNQQQRKEDEQTEETDIQLKGIDKEIIARIEQEIVDTSCQKTKWSDIAGLEHVRSQIEEVALWPLINPELFNGIAQPGSGLLLFGPPGTGKTMIGRAIANDANATFFSISASSLTSKWVGESEKLVRTLFLIAKIRQPSVIFVDEVDSMLCARSENDTNQRSLKTEFMVQLEGLHGEGCQKILFIGATNRPQELDDAIKRRFQKRLYIPLPNIVSRQQQIQITTQNEEKRGRKHTLSNEDINEIGKQTRGYSGADMKNLCTEVYLIPIREAIRANKENVRQLKPEQIREICYNDFIQAIKFNSCFLKIFFIRSVKATVAIKDLNGFIEWNKSYGSFNYTEEQLTL